MNVQAWEGPNMDRGFLCGRFDGGGEAASAYTAEQQNIMDALHNPKLTHYTNEPSQVQPKSHALSK